MVKKRSKKSALMKLSLFNGAAKTVKGTKNNNGLKFSSHSLLAATVIELLLPWQQRQQQAEWKIFGDEGKTFE